MSDADFSDAPDEALLVAYANGDGGAGRELVRRLAPRLHAHATRTLRDRAEAEDVVQETMIRLWTAAPDWRQGEAQVGTWCWRVCTNLCIDRLRRRRGTVTLDSVADPPSDSATPVERLTDADRATALEAALEDLPERQATAVRLRHLDGLSNPEIADIMDLTVEAVESLTARGKRALAQRLTGRKAELGYET